MESTPVNWEALDALLIDFAKSENLIEDSSAPSSSPSPSPSPSSSSYHSRLVIRQIRRAVETGAIDAAVALLRLHAPSILTDHKILFRLHKQKFIELLRKGTAEDRDSAIECLRTALAPCALDAYPEAYEEFKHVLLAFIYDKDDKNSPVANEWSEHRRLDLAGFMSSMLRAHLNAYDPIFSMALRYLISIHRVYCLRQGITSPISDLTERLLLEERDPPATPQDILYEVPPFDEVDIQALAHAVELTRQGAIDSLRFTKGDVFLAFQNELCRMRLDAPLLDQLVREYCVYRGIVDSETVKFNPQDPGYCSSRDCSLELDCNASKHSDGETSVTNAQMDGSPENNTDVTSMRRIDFEVRYASELASIHEDCSTSGSQQHEDASVLQRSRLPGNGERSKRKRWRGRYDDNSYMPNASLEENSKQEHSISTIVSTISKEKQGSEKLSVHDISNVEDRYEILLGMKELASKGMAAEAVEEVNAIDPNFFAQNSVLLFQLKQARFLVLSIAACDPALLKPCFSPAFPLLSTAPGSLKLILHSSIQLIWHNRFILVRLFLQQYNGSLLMCIGFILYILKDKLLGLLFKDLSTHHVLVKVFHVQDRIHKQVKLLSLKLVTDLSGKNIVSKRDESEDSFLSLHIHRTSNCIIHSKGGKSLCSSQKVNCNQETGCLLNCDCLTTEHLNFVRGISIHLLPFIVGNFILFLRQDCMMN
ncbi:hypothetical protein JHK87_047568 [Glycine soja]|nr:hypothetical protein JHK87_047568 [Glycine soja]